jgi:hypothetical protein
VDGVLSTRFSSEPFAASPESALVRFFDAPARTDPADRMHAADAQADARRRSRPERVEADVDNGGRSDRAGLGQQVSRWWSRTVRSWLRYMFGRAAE